MKIDPLLSIDFYKAGHVHQYPENTTSVYSNFTPRTSRIKEINKVVFFGT
jgi:nicotinamide phosphoribosyltransferase